MKTAVRLFALAGFSILAAGYSVGSSASDKLPMCWSPAQLKHMRSESPIRKRIAAAYRAPLTGTPATIAIGSHFVRGAIRRVQLPSNVRKIALSFDLCEQPYEISGYQGDIVDYLRDQKVPATFFASGKWFLTHSERAQQIMADPLFEFGNHAWEHRNFRVLDRGRAQAEINGAQLAYQRTFQKLSQWYCRVPNKAGSADSGVVKEMSLLRFPLGACNKQNLAWVNQSGLMAIQWDISSGDPWKGQTVAGVVNTVVSRARSGSIVLFHANGRGWKTGQALPQILRRLRARGFSFATVSDLLGTPGAMPVVSETCYDARPGDTDRYDALSRKLEQRYQAFYQRFAKPRMNGVKR